MYFVIDNSLKLYVKEYTCDVIESPLKPSRNPIAAILKVRELLLPDIIKQPLVISTEPSSSPDISSLKLLFVTRLLIIILYSTLFFIISVITKNIVMYPPIERQEVTELFILFFSISPRLASDIGATSLCPCGFLYLRPAPGRTKLIKSLDIIFIDPPYRLNMIPPAVEVIHKYNLLKKSGIIVTKIDTVEEIYEGNSEIILIDSRKYGNTTVCFYCYKEEEKK